MAFTGPKLRKDVSAHSSASRLTDYPAPPKSPDLTANSMNNVGELPRLKCSNRNPISLSQKEVYLGLCLFSLNMPYKICTVYSYKNVISPTV